jgi:hypothetical protein
MLIVRKKKHLSRVRGVWTIDFHVGNFENRICRESFSCTWYNVYPTLVLSFIIYMDFISSVRFERSMSIVIYIKYTICLNL